MSFIIGSAIIAFLPSGDDMNGIGQQSGGDNGSTKIKNPHHDSCCIKELHIAPMLNVSTVEFHAFMRILSKRCILWTEMIVDETIFFQRHRAKNIDEKENDGNSSAVGKDTNNDLDDAITGCTGTSSGDWIVPPHILYPIKNEDHPIVCQLGTINTLWTSVATQCVLSANYNMNELNINLDCPSNRVQGKEFGAVLMQDTSKVVSFVRAIQQQLPEHMCVSVKCRIGMIIDDTASTGSENDTTATTLRTDYDWIISFIKEVSVVCQRFILHARPVILHGIHNVGSSVSPAQNRCIPPLNYVWVYRICNQFPHCNFIINGGISDLITAKKLCYGVTGDDAPDDDYQQHAVPCAKCQQPFGSCVVPPIHPAPSNLRGCMIGRAAIDHPIQFAKIDQYWYNDADTLLRARNKATTRRQVLQQYCQFLDTLYPRRCCDSADTIMTCEIPAPAIIPSRPFCHFCQGFRQSSFVRACTNDLIVPSQPTKDEESTTAVPSDQSSNSVKIATRIVDRSLKPILNIFHGCHGSKTFRHHCETLRRNLDLRNCGPAFIIYNAAIQQSNISDVILDETIV